MVNPQSGEGVPSSLLEQSFAHEQILATSHLLTNLDIVKGLLNTARQNGLPPTDVAAALRSLNNAIFEASSLRYDAYNLISHYWPSVLGELGAPKLERANPMDILREMIDPYAIRAVRHNIHIVLDENPTHPIFPSMMLDVFAIRRAFHNLLSNAVKYSYHGSDDKRRHIRIWHAFADAQQRKWAIFFQNFGVGVEDAEHSLIFQPGQRGRLAILERRLGCGLGLTEAKKCIELHGGHLRLKSVPKSTDSNIGDSDSALSRAYLTTAWIILPEHTPL